MSSYRAKDALVHGRQLAVQELCVVCDIVNATSDSASIVSIDNSTLTASVVSLNINEDLSKIAKVSVTDRLTGAVQAASSAAINGQAIEVTINGTGLTDVCVEVKYVVS